jgi:hypothetical protein
MCKCLGKGHQNLMKFGMVVAEVVEVNVITFILRNFKNCLFYKGLKFKILKNCKNFRCRLLSFYWLDFNVSNFRMFLRHRATFQLLVILTKVKGQGHLFQVEV